MMNKAPEKPPSLREVARQSRDGGSFPAGMEGVSLLEITPSVSLAADSSLKEGALITSGGSLFIECLLIQLP